MVRAGKEAIASFRERKEKLAAVKEEQVALGYSLRAISDAVSEKWEYYKDLLKKWRDGVDNSVCEAAGWKEKRAMEKWEEKRVEKMRVKQVDKLI